MLLPSSFLDARCLACAWQHAGAQTMNHDLGGPRLLVAVISCPLFDQNLLSSRDTADVAAGSISGCLSCSWTLDQQRESRIL